MKNRQLARASKAQSVGQALVKYGLPVAASIGDMVLTNNQKAIANSVVRALGPVLGQLDKQITSAQQAFHAPMSHIPGPSTAVGTRVNKVNPRFVSTRDSITVVHREMLCSVNCINGTLVKNLGLINPYNPYIFPWLATIAGSYDRYKINAMRVEYVPFVSSTSNGAVILAWDPAGSDATSDYYDLSHMRSAQGNLWMPNMLTIPPCGFKLMGEQSGSTAPAKDLYNHGSLYFGTQGLGGQENGNLYVTYSVTFTNPQPSTGLSSVMDTTQVSGSPSSGYTVIDGFSTQNSGGLLLVPPGTWKVEYIGAGTAISAAAFAVGSGCTTSNLTFAGQGATGTVVIGIGFLRSNGTSSATVAVNLTFTTLTASQIRLTKVDPNSHNSSNILV